MSEPLCIAAYSKKSTWLVVRSLTTNCNTAAWVVSVETPRTLLVRATPSVFAPPTVLTDDSSLILPNTVVPTPTVSEKFDWKVLTS